MNKAKIAWGISGAGDKIRETKEVMEKIREKKEVDIHVFVSKAAEQVLKMYQIFDEIKNSFKRFTVEKNSNTPFLAGALQRGEYMALIIAPGTSNTVSKIAHCIGDTLLTNSASMALKAFTPVYIMPTDLEPGEVITELPNGDTLRVRVREEDAQNVQKLRETDDVHIIEGPEEINQHIQEITEK